MFVPLKTNAQILRLTLANTTNRAKNVKLFSFVEWCLWNASTDMENFHHGDEDRFLYFERCYADIAKAIAAGEKSRVDFEHGYATQKILLAMYESAEKGRLVEL